MLVEHPQWRPRGGDVDGVPNAVVGRATAFQDKILQIALLIQGEVCQWHSLFSDITRKHRRPPKAASSMTRNAAKSALLLVLLAVP